MSAPAPVNSPVLRRFVLRQSRLGTFTRCLILLVAVSGLSAYCFAWYRDLVFAQLRESADATALVGATRGSIEGDLRLFRKRWHEFAVAKPGDQAVFDLSEDDIRTLLRARSSLADRSEVRLVHDQAAVAVTFALADIPYFGDRFNSRFINFTATMMPILADGIPRVSIARATIAGNPVSEEYRKNLELICSSWLNNALVSQRDVLVRVKQMRIENGVIYLQQ
jgi:hypothetical protein